jgi:hypothetical protein
MRSPVIAGIFLLALVGLATADVLLVEGVPEMLATSGDPEIPPAVTTTTGGTTGIVKITGPDVLATIAQLGFTPQETTELSILRTVVPQQEAMVESHVLLKNGDRAGLIAWVESADVKNYYLALKEALHSSFSPEVRDLLDETQQQPGRPTRNLLTFLDPGLSSERIVFVRVRERLYELHVAPGNDDVLFELVEALTQ